MVNEKENPAGPNPENVDDEGATPPSNTEKELEENEEMEMFACPMCENSVSADANACPSCGAVFEEKDAVPRPYDMEEEQTLPYDIEGTQMPTPETDFPGNEPTEEMTPTPDVESGKGSGTGQQISTPLTDYFKRRRKRYLFGALTLGLGLVLFVLLWLVVVYDVLVTETENWFGVEVISILIGAGILFILGLYLILTYPKSSLIDVFASLQEAQKPEKPVGE